MLRSTRPARRPGHVRVVLLAIGGLLLLGPGAAPAAPALKATSFVRGTPARAIDAYPVRAIVGDVNGDGKDDAAFGYDGTVNVVYGSSPTADIDLSQDLGSRGFRLVSGLTGTGGFIRGVAAAGDFDRDGYDDLIVSLDTTDYIVYGAPNAAATRTLAAGSGMTALTGKGANDVEDSVAAAGDFDGDGTGDVVVQRGAIGAAIISGGPRVDAIALGSATGRVSLVNSTQRCGWVWFTFKCIYMGVPVHALGDVDGDGLDDLGIENANTPSSYVLYGRTGRFTTQPVAGSGKTTLPAPAQSEVAGTFVGAAGDVTGDGLADVLLHGAAILPGRRGRPGSIASTDPVIRITSPTTYSVGALPAGDQDGDGRADLAVSTGASGGATLRILTGLPRTAPATVDADGGAAVAGLPADFGGAASGGDLDGDGAPDLLVSSPYPYESTYVVSHGTGGPGPTTRPASLEADLILLDAAGNAINDWSGTLQATCAGTTTAQLPLGYPTTVLVKSASEGDACVVTGRATIDDPAPYAQCTWVDTVTHNYTEPVTAADGSFTLTSGINHLTIARQCRLPATAYPTAFTQAGWWASGGAPLPTPGDPWLFLTDGPNQARSLMWSVPLDWRNRTIEFTMRMAGGSGSADGMTLAFVRTGVGGPGGGRVGGAGPRLGFGGMAGAAVAFDVHQDAGDPSANFIGFTNGSSLNGGLNWLRTTNSPVPLREPGGYKVKIVNKAGTTTVYLNGVARMSGALPVASSTYLAVTASTGATYQYASALNFSTSAS